MIWYPLVYVYFNEMWSRHERSLLAWLCWISEINYCIIIGTLNWRLEILNIFTHRNIIIASPVNQELIIRQSSSSSCQCLVSKHNMKIIHFYFNLFVSCWFLWSLPALNHSNLVTKTWCCLGNSWDQVRCEVFNLCKLQFAYPCHVWKLVN